MHDNLCAPNLRRGRCDQEARDKMEQKGPNDGILILENELILNSESGGENAIDHDPDVLLLTNAVAPEPVVKKIDVGPRIFRSSGQDIPSERSSDSGLAAAWNIVRSPHKLAISEQTSSPAPAGDLYGPEEILHPPTGKSEAMDLAAMLTEARACAAEYGVMTARTRKALYAALGQTYDLTFYADSWPGEYARLLEEGGLTMQNRAPYSPIVKLVFGSDYDKKRVTEFAAAIIYGRRKNLPAGSFAEYLKSFAGGLKAVVGLERLIRKGEEDDGSDGSRTETRPAIANRLREISPQLWTELPSGGDEFALVLARRLPDGSIAIGRRSAPRCRYAGKGRA